MLATWVEEKEVSKAVMNTLRSLHIFQQFLNTRVVVFACARPVVTACLELGLDVVTSYPCGWWLGVRRRSNFAGVPLLREVLLAVRRLHPAEFYGFVDSSVLISPSLTVLLDALAAQHARQKLTDGVGVGAPREA